MTVLDRLTARLLAVLGLDLDFSIDLRGDAVSPITETLYVSRRPRPADTGALKDAGITHIVSCLDEGERSRMAFLGHEGFQTMFLAMRDGMDEDIAASIREFCDFACRARRTHPAAKVLVHCEVGVSRSATLATGLLMTEERMTFFEAFGQVRAKRAGVLPNIGFASQLQRLEHTLHPAVRDEGTLSSLARYLHEVCNVPVEVELLQQMLERHEYDAPRALRALFGGEIPRVVQGVRV